jgi:quercetin dioxygenase-like cupin family protein
MPANRPVTPPSRTRVNAALPPRWQAVREPRASLPRLPGRQSTEKQEVAMTSPVIIPHDSPDLQDMEAVRPGAPRYRLLIDADGGPSRALCQGIFLFAAGQDEPRHHHAIDETIHVLSGQGTFRLGDRSHPIGPGDSVFIPAGLPHAFAAEKETRLFFTFPADRFAEVAFHDEDTA